LNRHRYWLNQIAGVVLLAALAYVGYGWLGAGTRTTHLCEAITPGMSYGALNQFADSHGLRRASQRHGVATLVEHRSFGRAGCQVTLQAGRVIASAPAVND